MSLSEPFIHRPVGTTLLTVAVSLAGILGYFGLPVSPLPQVDFPTVQVSGGLPGASPETMASAVATPLERQFTRIAGLSEMSSTSTLGSTQITLQFDLGRNIDAACRDVQAAINAARGQLPPNLPNNPSYKKFNPSDFPVVAIGLTSDQYSRPQLYDVAATILQQKLAQVSGVGQVSLGGGSAPAVRVSVNPTVLNSMGLGMDQVRTALAASNANRPKGVLDDGDNSWAIAVNDQLLRAEQYADVIIAFRNGAPVRLGDIATVEDSAENIRTMGLMNGKPAVTIDVYRQPGANIIETANRVLALLPQLKSQIPAAIDLTVTLDRTGTIRASVEEVQFTLLLSIVLVTLVVYLFLGDLRSTLIPAVAVPVSLLGTFAVMYLARFSIDNLSLMAMTIATGFVVDDAIVVMEHITYHRERGLGALESAILGAKEIGFTVLSISVSLVAVFIPILLMEGLVGRLFFQFAVILTVAIGVSLVVSLTTTPMLCALLLKPKGDGQGAGYHSGGVIGWMQTLYGTTLRFVLRHQPVTLVLTVGLVALTTYLYVIIPKGFFPQQDSGRLFGNLLADQDTSFQTMSDRVVETMALLTDDPAVRVVTGSIGGSTNTARFMILLKPWHERRISAEQVVARMRQKAGRIQGAQLSLLAGQDLRVGGRFTPAQYQYTLTSPSLDDVNTFAPKLMEGLRKIPGVVDVNTDLQNKGLLTKLDLDRLAAARLGVTVDGIDNALYDAFGQRQVTRIYKERNQYNVVLGVEPQFAKSPDDLDTVYVAANTGKAVPLATLTSQSRGNVQLVVNHTEQFPSVTLSFNLLPGVSLGDVVPKISALSESIGLPDTIQARFQGTAQVFQASLRNQPLLILAALVAVYIVLGILYESYIHPITILSTLPSAGVGALLALMVCQVGLDVMGLIGILLLIGIVKKNAIMMIDFALEAKHKLGLSAQEAMYEACLQRFRPILMTTLAALLGSLPLAIGSGIGSELRRPMGIAVVGGMILSQLLTLYTTPVVYLFLDRFSKDHKLREMDV